ncbi:hypothetical protein [uncultured Arsenicicoccus sp.]|uniref:hypothetical protein n=1 Tax=uncultured Arsenicicoccus sp. TaxID=491339 RepID=UPI0025943A12|nr:hypothetical protein [uncultured Arsenicicoccus sp.]
MASGSTTSTSWAAVVVAFTVGLGCAVYETTMLLDAPTVPTVLRCWAAGSAYLSLVVAASALAAVVARGVLAGFATVAGTLMIGLPLLGMAPVLRPWVPHPGPPPHHRDTRGTAADVSPGGSGVMPGHRCARRAPPPPPTPLMVRPCGWAGEVRPARPR